MRAGLIGENVGNPSAPHHFRQDLGAVPDKPYRKRAPFAARSRDQTPGFVKLIRYRVQIPSIDAPLDTRRIDFDTKKRRAVHGCRQRLGAAHSSKTAGHENSSFKRTAEVLPCGGRERFIRSLDDSLSSNVDPAPSRHLAIHGELQRFQPIEFVPRCPMRNEVRIRNQYSRRVRKCPENAYRFARLNKQRLVVLQVAERAHNPMKGFPTAGSPARSTVHDELPWILRNLFIEVVHEHPHRGFLMPTFARDGGPAWCAYRRIGNSFCRHVRSSGY